MVVGTASVGCRCMLCISKSNALLLPLVSNPPNIGTDAHSAASGPSMSSSLSTALGRRRPPSSTCTSLPVLPLRPDYHRSTTEYGPNAGCVSWLLWPVPIVIWFPLFFFIHVRLCLLFACLYAYVHTLTLSCHLHPPVCRSTSPVICSSSASSCQAPWCCSYRRRMCDVLVLMATASRAPPLLSGLLGVLL